VGSGSLVVFLTAHRALVDAARVRPGETVLVHGAAGGIGLAGIQVAKRCGARVIATAGTPERRAFARTAGADEVLDSRSLDFVDQVRALTGGRGADVVLSAAPGEVLAANLGVAAEFGRVVEVGKSGIYSGAVLDLAPFDRNLTLIALDTDRMLATRRDLLVDLVEDVVAEFEAGHYTELPTTAYPVTRAAEALEQVARSGQVGRVVLTFDDDSPAVRPAAPRCRVVPTASYLITGGFGDFGLATARWLVDSGARHLAMVGRRGATTDAAKAQLATFAEAGVEVLELAADVSSAAEVTAMIGQVGAAMPPLRGVFHAAGLLDDRAFTEVDAASLETVMAPKARGALNLHRATAGLELDHFVLYSSASAITGNVPQTTYCAANTVLDSLAALRRAEGLPALTVNWGSLAGGMAESSEDVRRYLEMIGLGPIDLGLATLALGECLAVGVAHAGVLDLDWVRWGATHPLSSATARFTEHVAAAGSGAEVNPIRTELARLPAEQRAEVLAYVLAEQLAAVLGIPADALDLTTPLPELGLDSLMAVDLRARVTLALDVEVSALEFSRGVGLAALARKVLPLLVPTQNGE
jgi:NAD(P)-dependent dehydrogenase (short-subunit alcohol dehydrogenase family)/acyl carrier protein